MDERWVKVDGYPAYSISTEGRIRHDRTGHIKKQTQNYLGYAVVCLSCGDGHCKTVLVHLLMAKAFLPPKPAWADEVNHKDGDKMNPRLSNLEWITSSGNKRHAIDTLGVMKGTHHAPRPVLLLEPLRLFGSITAAARATGCCVREVLRCIEHPEKDYTARGYRFVDANTTYFD